MRLMRNFLFWFFLILITVNVTLFGHFYFIGKNNNLSSVLSPLSRTLSQLPAKEADATGFWQPTLTTIQSNQQKLKLTARSAISYDLDTNTMLFGKDIDKKLPIASLTKIMTAIIAIENLDLSTEVSVSRAAATIGEGTMGLSEGEILSIEDLLYGLMLQSGNDAAETIAEGSKLGRAEFIHLMNKKAEDLGLSKTRFTNPSGLQGDGEQYGTVKELLVLTRYAMAKPEFAKIVGTYEHHIPYSNKNKEFNLYNETNLLTTYPGIKGVKTGFTDEAGMCLVSYLDYQGHRIIAVLLNSENRRQEMMDLLDYSLLELDIRPPKHG